jgi:hypothetical protein
MEAKEAANWYVSLEPIACSDASRTPPAARVARGNPRPIRPLGGGERDAVALTWGEKGTVRSTETRCTSSVSSPVRKCLECVV